MLQHLIQGVRKFKRDERGDFGIKGLAITVGAIVVIGAVVFWLANGEMIKIVETVWEQAWGWITGIFEENKAG